VTDGLEVVVEGADPGAGRSAERRNEPAGGAGTREIPAGAARVLVVDDERFFRERIREVLTAHGLASLEAKSGEQAIELATHPEVGVVVLDIRLPGIDGIEVLRRLRDQRPQLRVIMLSASTDQELVLEALRLGACDYLAKPLHDEELILAVQRAWESFSVATDWTRLRGRLDKLVESMEELASHATRNGDPDGQHLRDAAAHAAAEVLEAHKTSLMLLNEDQTALRVEAAVGREISPRSMDEVQLGEGVAGIAFEKGEPLIVEDLEHDGRFGERAAPDRYESSSFAVAPLGFAGERLGVLCATDRIGGEGFGPEDLSLLRLLAMQISEFMALGRTRLSDGANPPGRALDSATEDQTEPFAAGMPEVDEIEEIDRDAELARLICDAVVSEVEPERVIRAALEPLAARLPAAPVSLYLLDAASGDLLLEGQCDGGARSDRPTLPAKAGLSGTVFQTGHLVAADRPELDGRFDLSVDTPSDAAVGPLLCLPLHFRGKIVGIFRAFPVSESGSDRSSHPGIGKASASARTGEVLATVLSAAVRNVLLYRSLVATIEEVAEVRREARS